MAIIGWIIVGVVALMLGGMVLGFWKLGYELKTILISSIASVVIIVGMIIGGFWYYGNVASQNAFTEVFPLLLSSEKGYRELISYLNVGSIH